jgi:hypothetical protein
MNTNKKISTLDFILNYILYFISMFKMNTILKYIQLIVFVFCDLLLDGFIMYYIFSYYY